MLQIFRFVSLGLVFYFVSIPIAYASATFPFVKAATSDNGKFMVIAEYEYDNLADQIRRIKRVTYQVVQKERFINNHFDTNNGYWSDYYWNASSSPGVPLLENISLPVISDDGEFLALLVVSPLADADKDVLQILHNKSGRAEIIGTYKLKDIKENVSPSKPADIIITDASPMWFDTMSLKFSLNNQEFIIKNTYGTKIISLTNGVIYSH